VWEGDGMVGLWVVRGILLLLFLPILVPFRVLFRAFRYTGISIALLLLSLAMLCLAIVLAIITGVLGPLLDVLIVSALILMVWKWPRGLRAQFPEKVRLAYRGAFNAACDRFRCSTGIDYCFCVSIVLFALVLSLSSGFLHFAITVLVVLAVIGIIWKWPTSSHLPLQRKLVLALRELWKEMRERFRY